MFCIDELVSEHCRALAPAVMVLGLRQYQTTQ